MYLVGVLVGLDEGALAEGVARADMVASGAADCVPGRPDDEDRAGRVGGTADR